MLRPESSLRSTIRNNDPQAWVSVAYRLRTQPVARNDSLSCRRGLATESEHVAIDVQSGLNSGMVTGDGPPGGAAA